MTTWPLLNRNKVVDSKVSVSVKACAELDNENVRIMAQKVHCDTTLIIEMTLTVFQLLDHWETLPMYNRIPKRVKQVYIHLCVKIYTNSVSGRG